MCCVLSQILSIIACYVLCVFSDITNYNLCVVGRVKDLPEKTRIGREEERIWKAKVYVLNNLAI